MTSVVIAAHNEENSIDVTLRSVTGQCTAASIEIIVSANACTDRTAEVAARPGVIVIDKPEPGKARALNAGDDVATSFPRLYLDADILVPPDGISAILRHFETDRKLLAVFPRRHVETAGRPWPVRAYFAINQRLPVFREGLFGRGLVALSEEGRRRFSRFPEFIADDLFLDSQFSTAEKAEASDVEVIVAAPYTTRDLVRRLMRVRRGNAQLRSASAGGALGVDVRPADRWAWLREVVIRDPRLAPAAIPYLAITATAALLAKRKPAVGREWGRDESTRRGVPPGPRADI